MNTKTPVMILQELMVKRQLTPHFDLVFSGGASHEPEFHYFVEAGPVSATAVGRSKKEAKHEVARIALEKLEKIGWYVPNKLIEVNTPGKCRSPSPSSPIRILVNHVGALKDLCAEKKLPEPETRLISDTGPAHARQFTIQYTVGSIKYSATASTKKAAKQVAARRMLHCLMDTLDNAGSVDIVPLEEFENMDIDAKDMWKDLKNTNPDKSRKISLYHKSLQDLDENIREMAKNILEFGSRNKPLKLLEDILKCFDVDQSVESFPHKNPNLYMMLLRIQTDPECIFYGTGKSKEEAIVKATLEAIDHLKLMLS